MGVWTVTQWVMAGQVNRVVAVHVNTAMAGHVKTVMRISVVQ